MCVFLKVDQPGDVSGASGLLMDALWMCGWCSLTGDTGEGSSQRRRPGARRLRGAAFGTQPSLGRGGAGLGRSGGGASRGRAGRRGGAAAAAAARAGPGGASLGSGSRVRCSEAGRAGALGWGHGCAAEM